MHSWRRTSRSEPRCPPRSPRWVKLLLASESDEAIRKRMTSASFAGEWGPKAAQSVEALLEQISRIRTDGYAVQDEELARGLRSIAWPIRQANGHVAWAVDIALPAAEFTMAQMPARFREPLLCACTEISRRLAR